MLHEVVLMFNPGYATHNRVLEQAGGGMLYPRTRHSPQEMVVIKRGGRVIPLVFLRVGSFILPS